MTDREVNTFPTVSLYNVSAKYIYIDLGHYNGPVSVTVPACYGNSDKITYDFSHSRVGRVTFEEGTKVIYEQFPAVADRLFENTLEKRKQTAEYAAGHF